MLLKCCTHKPANLENLAVVTRLEKISFYPTPKERQCQRTFKLLYIALISHAGKEMLKILQVRLQQYVYTMNFQMYKLDLEKEEEPEIKFPTCTESKKKQGNSKKLSTSASLTMWKPLTLFSSVQLLSRVQLFMTPWNTACQASLSITNSWSLLKLISIESVMPSNHLIIYRPLLLLPSIFPSIRVFSNESVKVKPYFNFWKYN